MPTPESKELEESKVLTITVATERCQGLSRRLQLVAHSLCALAPVSSRGLGPVAPTSPGPCSPLPCTCYWLPDLVARS